MIPARNAWISLLQISTASAWVLRLGFEKFGASVHEESENRD